MGDLLPLKVYPFTLKAWQTGFAMMQYIRQFSQLILIPAGHQYCVAL